VPLLFVVAKIGASCFLRRMVVRYGAAVVRMMVRTISKVEILRRTLTTIRSDKNCFINCFLLNLCVVAKLMDGSIVIAFCVFVQNLQCSWLCR